MNQSDIHAQHSAPTGEKLLVHTCPPRNRPRQPRLRQQRGIYAFCLMAFLVGGLNVASGWAQLKWEKTEVELTAPPGQTELTAEFPFVNQGPEPVTVNAVTGSCSCTVAQLAKKTYQPGERGQITAVFKVGDRVGKQVTTVMVQAGAAQTPPTVLHLTVLIPELYRVTPRLVFWREKEEPKGKTVKIEFPLAGETPVHVTGVKSNQDQIRAAVQEVKAGKEYTLTLTPVGTDQEVYALVTVTTDSSLAKLREFTVMARVIGKNIGMPGIPGFIRPGYRPLPAHLQWQLGEETASKAVMLELARPKQQLRVTRVESNSPDFTAEWKALEEGRRYVVVIRPTTTQRPSNGVVRVWTEEPPRPEGPGETNGSVSTAPTGSLAAPPTNGSPTTQPASPGSTAGNAPALGKAAAPPILIFVQVAGPTPTANVPPPTPVAGTSSATTSSPPKVSPAPPVSPVSGQNTSSAR